MQCCIQGCDNELTAHSRLKTCANCRQALHAWAKRRPAEIVERAQRLNKYRARLATIATVTDEDAKLVDPFKLQNEGLWRASARKAKATVASLKLRARKKA